MIMSGIPVYTQSPINAAKATGITPQTTTPQGHPPSSNPIPAAVTTSTSSSTYPSAQPGAASGPGPTFAPQLPLQPTPTTRETTDNPPQPQPGGLPTPASRKPITPQKSDEVYRPQETNAPPALEQPYQMGIPSPTQHGVQPPRSSTSTTTTAAASYPVVIPAAEFGGPRRSLEHPPNYQQNTYASELTSDQRRAHEANTSGTRAQDTSDSVGGIDLLNTAKKWAQQAGSGYSQNYQKPRRRCGGGSTRNNDLLLLSIMD
ncbi:hypothetical protein N431DRAFT_155047 [Stipitochalara longipes BDJ]|nr:hypothetical protein N431DRAFT_155047 [Stipitochalara longipes BDJ]